MPSLEVFNDLIEVPWESQHVGMLLLREFGVDAKSSVLGGDVDFTALFRLLGDNGRVGELAHAGLRESHSASELVPLQASHEESLGGGGAHAHGAESHDSLLGREGERLVCNASSEHHL